MPTVKSTYKKSVNKRIVQDRLYMQIKGKYNRLIGLGGPDLNDYLTYVRKSGIKSATIYEYDVDQLFRQISGDVDQLPTQVIFKDILDCPSGVPNTFYDFDFCCSVIKARKHIKKFRNDPGMFTFSIRPLTIENSIKEFVKLKQGNRNYELTLAEDKPSYKLYNLKLEDSEQQVYIYKDSTPMLVITNF